MNLPEKIEPYRFLVANSDVEVVENLNPTEVKINEILDYLAAEKDKKE
jgi:hypothetical protein